MILAGLLGWLSLPLASARAETTTAVLLEQLIADLRFLTSEELRGRSAVDPSIDVAGRYIADRFSQIGLQTELFGDGPFQSFDISVGSDPTTPDKNFIEFRVDESVAADAARRLELGDSFSPLAIGLPAGTVTAPVVWVGYGIQAPKLGYDDYEGVDVAGKIVMLLRKEPGADDPESPFDGVENTPFAYFDAKIATAIDQGAAGVLLINDPASVAQSLAGVQSRIDAEESRRGEITQAIESLPAEAANSRRSMQEQLDRIDSTVATLKTELESAKLGVLGVAQAGNRPRGGSPRRVDEQGNRLRRLAPVPVASIPRATADALLAMAGKTLAEIEADIDSTYKPASRELAGVEATLSVELSAATAKSSNVVGVLPGRGELAEQTLVIGAHYDHVGMGGEGSLAPGTVAVHNGADDNASGTSALLATATKLVDQLRNADSHRRIVFIAFTGEERGLLGSKHYVEQPRFPIADTVAMVNMDMVGRLRDNELTVYGTGSASVMDGLLDAANVPGPSGEPFKLVRVESGYGPSDHASFYAAGVPVLFFFTGLHEDYHRPSDDFENLNLGGMIRITDMVCQVSESLATDPDRPIYEQTADQTAQARPGVFMGVSMSQQDGVVLVSAVVAGSPAETAGLRVDDELVSFGTEAIERVENVFGVLRGRQPGDKLPIVVRRGGESLTLEIELGKR